MITRRKNHAAGNGYHAGIGAAVRKAVARLRAPATASTIARRLNARKGATRVTRQAVDGHLRAIVNEKKARRLPGGAVEPII